MYYICLINFCLITPLVLICQEVSSRSSSIFFISIWSWLF